MKYKVLIVDRLHDSIVPLLEEAGLEVHYEPKIDRLKLKKILPEFDGLIDRSYLELNKPILDLATKLKFIARAGAGLDKIDLEEVDRRGIQLFNAPEGNRDALAEHAMALLLSLLNNFKKSGREVRRWKWEREGNRGHEISSKTVGLIGYGHMGRSFAKRLVNFGCDIIAYDKYKTGFSDDYAQEVSIEDIFEKADILSLHIPLTDETDYLVDYEFLKKFKKPIWLMNTARGKNLKTKDLIKALNEGIVLGAGLDVLENEKLETLSFSEKDSYSQLFNNENVIITPHVGGWSFESHVRINQVLVDKIKDYFS